MTSKLFDMITLFAAATPQHAGAGRRASQQRVPLPREHGSIVMAKPIHVVQQHEPRERLRMMFEKVAHRRGVNVESIDHSQL